MADFCYYCDGTGERDFLSGAPCHECGGTGWREDRDEPLTEEEEEYWDEFNREQEERSFQDGAMSNYRDNE